MVIFKERTSAAADNYSPIDPVHEWGWCAGTVEQGYEVTSLARTSNG